MKKLLKADRKARFEYKVWGQQFNGMWVVFHGADVERFELSKFNTKAEMIEFLTNYQR